MLSRRFSHPLKDVIEPLFSATITEKEGGHPAIRVNQILATMVAEEGVKAAIEGHYGSQNYDAIAAELPGKITERLLVRKQAKSPALRELLEELDVQYEVKPTQPVVIRRVQTDNPQLPDTPQLSKTLDYLEEHIDDLTRRGQWRVAVDPGHSGLKELIAALCTAMYKTDRPNNTQKLDAYQLILDTRVAMNADKQSASILNEAAYFRTKLIQEINRRQTATHGVIFLS